MNIDLSSHGIVALVKNKDGKFLLLQDSREPMKGLWAPPHGRLEASDSSEKDGVIREVKEETDLRVTPIKSILTQSADTKVRTVSFWLVESGSDEIVLNDESSDYRWCSVEEGLKLPLYPGTKALFEKVEKGEVKLN